MAYRIDPTAAFAAEFRRIALEQNRKAAAVLADPDLVLETAAFETRKHLKKLRGLLRLVEPELPDFAAAENRRYRAAGRRLSQLRDDAMIPHALQALAAAGLDPDAAQRLDARLAQAAPSGGEAGAELRRLALGEVVEGRSPIEAFVLRSEKRAPSLVGRGVARTYRRGRRLLATALDTRDERDLHALRGEAKRHWMHLRLLQPLWPEVLQPAADAAKSLADDLGADHDQAVLRAALRAGPEDDDAAAALALSDEASAVLRERALAVAARLFTDRPRAVRSRFTRLYRLAKQ